MRVSTTGRAGRQLAKFLLDRQARINVKNNEKRCFGYAVAWGITKVVDHVVCPGNYSHLFQKYEPEQIKYPIEVADIHPNEDKLKMSFNVYSFFDDDGKGRHSVYATAKKIGLLY